MTHPNALNATSVDLPLIGGREESGPGHRITITQPNGHTYDLVMNVDPDDGVVKVDIQADDNCFEIAVNDQVIRPAADS